MADDPSAVMITDFPIPLMPDEAERVTRMLAGQNSMDALLAYGEEHADEFCGLYIDREAGGVTVILFTASRELHALAVAARAPAGMTAQVRACRFSERELLRVQEEVTDAALRRVGSGFEFLSSSLDTIRNVVTVEVKTNDPTYKALTEA